MVVQVYCLLVTRGEHLTHRARRSHPWESLEQEQSGVCAALFDLAVVPASLAVSVAQRKTALTPTLVTAMLRAHLWLSQPPFYCPQHPGHFNLCSQKRKLPLLSCSGAQYPVQVDA